LTEWITDSDSWIAECKRFGRSEVDRYKVVSFDLEDSEVLRKARLRK